MKPKRLQVAVAQMKFRPTIHENVRKIVGLIYAAAQQGADAILFPECAVTGYRREFNRLDAAMVEEGCRVIAQAARETHCNVLIGTPTCRRNRWFNSLLVLNRQGREVFRYSKIHLTEWDARHFTPGNSIALFRIDGILATAIICHERRYPELVRLPAMMGAQVVFHPNAGLDPLNVSKTKRGGRDGIAIRAFENQIYYVFANSVGPQGNGLWSAGDSKIVAPDSSMLAMGNNRDEMVISAQLDLSKAGRKYAREALQQPLFLRAAWKEMLATCKRQRPP
jgi:omega-amidase